MKTELFDSIYNQVAGLSEDGLLSLPDPTLNSFLYSGGLSGEKPLDAALRYYRTKFLPSLEVLASKNVEAAQRVLLSIKENKLDLSLLTTKAVTDLIIDIERLPEAPYQKGLVALALIMIRIAMKPPKDQ